MYMDLSVQTTGAIVQKSGFDKSLCGQWLDWLDVSKESKRSYRIAIKQFFLFLQAEAIAEPDRVICQ